MDYKTLKAEKRTEFKKSAAKRLRAAGKIPAVMYGHNDPLTISVDEKEFVKKFSEITENTIITIKIGKNDYSVLVKSFQDDILTQKIKHIDFFEIEQGKTLHTHIPVHVTGSAKGVREGGVLEQRLHELEVECLPQDIPEIITVDVTELEAGEAIHVADIPAPEGVKILNLLEQTVVSVALIREEVEETEEEENEEEGAEGEGLESEEESEESSEE
jgi:large subunit ribosomal protein L25